MNIDAERLLPLIELIYDAALQPKQWHVFTDALCPLLSSRNCNFHAVDVTTNRLQFIHNTIPAFLVQLYLKKFHPRNPFFTLAGPLAQPGVVLLSHEVMPSAEFEKTEFHRYMRIIGLYHAIHLTVLREDNIISGLALARPKKGGAYTEVEARPLRLLYPHLQRAFRIGRMLGQLQQERELLSQTLNRLPQGAVVVNASGHTIYCNQTAQHIFDSRDGLYRDRNNRLCAPRAADENQLHRLINSASQRDPKLALDCGGILQLDRPSGLRSLSLLIAPLNLETSYLNFQQPAALIFINDPEQHMEPVEKVLQRLYDLTPAEARLASVLVQGKNIVEAAEELNVSQNTARTHLKHIFQKTGAKRQSELVQLLLNSPAVLKS